MVVRYAKDNYFQWCLHCIKKKKKLLLIPCFNFKKVFLFKTFICYITEIRLEFISEKQSLEIVFENNNVMD